MIIPAPSREPTKGTSVKFYMSTTPITIIISIGITNRQRYIIRVLSKVSAIGSVSQSLHGTVSNMACITSHDA